METKLKITLIFLEIQTLIFFSCANKKPLILNSQKNSNIYTITQLKENKDIYKLILQKEIIIYTINDSLINGYFYEINNDSLLIEQKKSRNLIERIPIAEINYIILKQDINYKVKPPKTLEIIIILLLFAFVIYSLNSLGNLNFP